LRKLGIPFVCGRTSNSLIMTLIELKASMAMIFRPVKGIMLPFAFCGF
jgi:hypothetical protein